ncbi:MAG: formyltransferase family protein [Solirubrobacterales bacterium]
MVLKRVALLAADTARSQAYIQALVAHDLFPETVITLGVEPRSEPDTEPRPTEWQGIFLPDLSQSVPATCRRAGIPMIECTVADVNSEAAAAAVRQSGADIVIYSGRGGQIVAEAVLGLGPVFLHMHSGWLPDYRGSTTVYYSLLNGQPPGVTAITLDRTIDTGPIVARRQYPVPPAGMDVDRLYDSAIRADLLIRVMKEYQRTGQLQKEEQPVSAGSTYYVIHPVLKHIAILSLAAGTTAAAEQADR